jgi:hypothetical protein
MTTRPIAVDREFAVCTYSALKSTDTLAVRCCKQRGTTGGGSCDRKATCEKRVHRSVRMQAGIAAVQRTRERALRHGRGRAREHCGDVGFTGYSQAAGATFTGKAAVVAAFGVSARCRL